MKNYILKAILILISSVIPAKGAITFTSSGGDLVVSLSSSYQGTVSSNFNTDLLFIVLNNAYSTSQSFVVGSSLSTATIAISRVNTQIFNTSNTVGTNNGTYSSNFGIVDNTTLYFGWNVGNNNFLLGDEVTISAGTYTLNGFLSSGGNIPDQTNFDVVLGHSQTLGMELAGNLSAVPEPSSTMLLSCITILFFRRNRKM